MWSFERAQALDLHAAHSPTTESLSLSLQPARVRVMSSTAFFHTKTGEIVLGDSLDFMRKDIPDSSVDLIMTSPPFGLVRKKTYGNVDAHDYVEWFRPFGTEFRRILKPSGSLVIDIGGAWISGQPTRSLYQDAEDMVFDPLVGSCVTGGAAGRN